jgi:hypothetical protein
MLDNAYALVVGIAAYRHLRPLPETVAKDARDVHELLTNPRYGGYQADHAELLLDDAATRRTFVNALHRLAERTDDRSSVLVYLSSHGGRIDSGPRAGEYLLMVDTLATTPGDLAATAVSGQEFSDALRAIPARKVVVVFDCCHAGGIGQPKGAADPGLEPGLPERFYEALQAGRGRAILASSRSTELSWVLPGAHNSLFTQHLLAGLGGGIASEDGLIRIFDLFEYLQPRVTADQPRQHPIFKAELEENFPVALHPDGPGVRAETDQWGFRYDAYVSYVDRDPDATWVWDTLVPHLERAGLRVAVSGDVEQPGAARVVGIERGISQSRRTVVVLSPAYLDDNMADFENVLALTMGIEEGTYRVLPVRITDLDAARLPFRLSMLSMLDLAHPRRAQRELGRLVDALRSPLPRR